MVPKATEADTRAKLIDPALHKCGWTEEHIKREVSAGAIEIIRGQARRRAQGRVDYLLRIKLNPDTQPVAVALIEAKAEHLPPNHGLEQGKLYANSKRLNVPFVFSSNGHLFVEYDRITGLTSQPKPMNQFPNPVELQARYEQGMGFKLTEPSALPLLTRYSGGEGNRRYYQDAAIRAVFEAIAQGKKRAMLSLATGAGKTFIAVQLLKRIADAGQLRKALFICDRDELRSQGTIAFQKVFGSNAMAVSNGKPEKNARVLIATYQTLDIDTEDGGANFLTNHYPENYFSHIIIDECHRSAWGKWSQVFTHNPDAIQIGLTATPRQIEVTEKNKEALQDAKITADNHKHFGEPVYEYDMSQGIEDGYLAACEIERRDVLLDGKKEREYGVTKEDLKRRKLLADAYTGEVLSPEEARKTYRAASLESKLILPERVSSMCSDFFSHLLATGGPEQKTIIFCASDDHADKVAAEMGNLYAIWCSTNGKKGVQDYAFKCTASNSGGDYLADFRGSMQRYMIATTVDLLSTGVDITPLRNVVFFRYVQSPILFYQMVGRGTRIDTPTGKLMFRLYDYTDATRLFGEEFLTKFTKKSEKPRGGGEGNDDGINGPPPPPPERTIIAQGFEVKITDAGKYILTMVDGKAMPVTVEEYKERLSQKLIQEAPTVEDFRSRWVNPNERRTLLSHLPDAGHSALLVRMLEEMDDFDLYDVLAELGYGVAPKTRIERVESFVYKHEGWLKGLPERAANTIKALANQFAKAGTDGLESQQIFRTPEVMKAGGLESLKLVGKPGDLLRQTKERMFVA
ncbi:DEAD/DEAH box helicase family protein [Heliobacterium undosum]|uniref:DEAD/DEAH box helicase family protein n=1 Tax=Heliomicrobium undosum TaxID=121734 RepID=A0A845L175_9FIRM|nr:DEAD/DEAH box helicase family protein [Heliomicrobium undosum]MZP28709.1 DEAD/DEAH box helicase family protein [Heliomicrobium undosum]